MTAPRARAVAVPLRAAAVFLIANFVLVQAVLILGFRTPVQDTGVYPIAWFLEGRQGHDSWDPMAQAYEQSRTTHRVEKPFYWRTAFSPQVIRKGFQYPPTALLLVSGLDAIVAERWAAALRVITWLMVPLTAVLVWRLYERLALTAGLDGGPRALVFLTAVMATLTFYPVMRAYANGQMQTWLNAAFAAMLLCWAHGRRAAAGALDALGCAFKPQLGLFVLWALVRRQWAFVGAWAVTASALLLISVAVYGWSPHVEYLGMLRFLGERGEAFYPNQSVNGLLQRALRNGDILSWRQPWVEHFPPFDARIFWTTTITSAILVAIGLIGPRRDRGGVLDMCVMGLVATMASPIAWEHHYGVLLPIFAVVFVECARARVTRGWWVALATCYVLIGDCFWVTKRLADSRWNVLESYLFFGAVGFLILILKLPMMSRPTEGTEP